MSSRPRYFSGPQVFFKEFTVAPAYISRTSKAICTIQYNTQPEYKVNTFVDIYINNTFYTTTQQETLDLSGIEDQFPVQLKMYTKRFISGTYVFSSVIVYLTVHNKVCSETILVQDHTNQDTPNKYVRG